MNKNFNKQIFLGNGEHSKKDCDKLKELLNEAIITLSGIQQPMPCTSEYDVKQEKQEIKQYQNEIENTVKDIAMALTGKNINFEK